MREALSSNQKIVAKLGELERHLESHDSDIQQLIEAIRELMTPPEPNRRRIGFEPPPAQAKAHGKKK
jgi:hypothetical protein